jgi:hypothetical protein
MELIPEWEEEPNEAKFELFTVSLVGTLALAAAVLILMSWKRLRAKVIAPADAPILVE